MTTGFQPTTMMVIDPDTYPSLASLLGLDFLRRYRVVIDFPQGTIVLR